MNLGLTTLIATEFLYKSPIFTASYLSTSMNLLGSFVTSNLLCSCKLSKIVSTKLSPPACKLANNLGAHTRDPRMHPAVDAKHRVSSGSVPLCHQHSVRVPPIVLAAACRAPPVALFYSRLPPKPPGVIFRRVAVAMRAHVRQCDPPSPPTAAMIRLKKSVLFCITFCCCADPSLCLAWQWLCFSIVITQG